MRLSLDTVYKPLANILYDLMIKKFVYLGIGLIILAVVLFIISGYLFSNEITNSVSFVNLTVRANSFSYYVANYHNTSEIAIYALADQPVNFYLMNSTAFSGWSGQVSSNKSANGLRYAQQLKLNATSIFENQKTIMAPVLVNGSGSYPGNSVYVVIDNTFGSSSVGMPLNASVAYFPLRISRIVYYDMIGVAAIILFIAGIIVSLYGAFKKSVPKTDSSGNAVPTKEDRDKEYVEQLYKGVKKSGKKKSGAKAPK